MGQTIKTFLFDMGNVLVYFSHDRMCSQIGSQCGLSGRQVRELLIGSGLQWQFERGELSNDEFHQVWQQACGRRVTLPALLRAATEIFWPHPEMMPLLAALKRRGHRLVLLSNTCRPHFEFVREKFSVLDLFDDFVVSYRVGAMKPSREIFAAALRQIECSPEECFYTDDVPEYVAAGRTHGLQAELFTTTESLRKHLAQRDILV